MKPRIDNYANFEALRQSRKAGEDYSITVLERSKDVVVLAPHGGKIEFGTSEIAREIAGHDHSLYLFEGKMQNGNGELHITSTNFDEPRAIKLVAECVMAITIHGRKDEGDSEGIFLGGLDGDIRLIAVYLNNTGFRTRVDGHKFPATNLNNICNRTRTRKGTQLELPASLRRILLKVSACRGRFISAIQSAIDSCHQPNS